MARRCLLTACVALLVATSMTAAEPAPVRWPRCGAWTVVATIDPRHVAGFEDVAVVDPWHAYAVGWITWGQHTHAIAAVWNGWEWSRTPLAVPPGAVDPWTLSSVAARSPREVWAVGARGRRPLVERFDGRRWRIVVVPVPRGHSWLEAITTVPGSADLWAVGGRARHGRTRPFAIRRTGGRWIRSPMPEVTRELSLHGVVSTGRATWAVGTLGDWAHREVSGAVVLRWTDAGWARAAIPDGRGVPVLWSIAAAGPADVIAAGGSYVIRWDGRRWARVGADRIPGLPRLHAEDVAFSTAGDAWIVGGFDDPSPDAEWELPAAYHRAGGGWVRTMLQRPRGAAYPEGVGTATSNDVWVVGQQGGYDASPFAQHRC